MRADNAVVTAIIKTDEEFLREVADRLRARMARTAQDIVEIGLDLIEVRARVGDGKFSAWIEAEFTMSRVTAYKMIKVAETFGETGVNQFTPSVLYALASPDTPEGVRTEITERAAAGEKVTVADVRSANAVVRRGRQNGEVDLVEARRKADCRTVTTGIMEMLDLFERDGVDPADRAAHIIEHFDRDMAGKIGKITIKRLLRTIEAVHIVSRKIADDRYAAHCAALEGRK
jgi:hypothetical protein